MPRLVPKGAPDSPALEVSDEAVDSWTALGYVPVQEKSTTKTAAKRTSSRKTSK